MTSQGKDATLESEGSNDECSSSENKRLRKEDDVKSNRSCDDASTSHDMMMDFTNVFTSRKLFETRDDLLTWVKDVGKQNGMVIVVKRSDAGKCNRGRIYLGCTKGGEYRETLKKMGKKMRNKGTKKCGCPFLLKGRQLEVKGEWTLEVVHAMHNHLVDKSFKGDSNDGRLPNLKEKNVVQPSMRNSRPKTISNNPVKQEINESCGRPQMQFFMDKLLKHDYKFFQKSCESTKVVMNLFFAHPKSIDLLRAFPSVVLIDCTYQTTMYKYTMLEIVGVISTDMTFCVACAYIESEKEDNYIWALSTLRSLMDESCYPSVIITIRDIALMNAVQCVFPATTHFLCRSHISKNILVNCRKHFKLKDEWGYFNASWNVLVSSEDEQTFEDLLERFRVKFPDIPNADHAVNYAIKNWIEPYKERFVCCWTSKKMHYENVTSCRAEGHHATLKKHLSTSMSNFEHCWFTIHTTMETLHAQIEDSFKMSVNVGLEKFETHYFKFLRSVVSVSALQRIHKVLKEVSDDELVDPVFCDCMLRKTCGLPCAHELLEFVKACKPIPLECVDKFWQKLSIEETLTEESKKKVLRVKFMKLMDDLMKKFDSSSYEEQELMLKRLQKVLDDHEEPIVDSQGVTPTRGRPKLGSSKALKSTKRDPSVSFECTENTAVGNCSPLPNQATIYKTAELSGEPTFSSNKRQKMPVKDIVRKSITRPETLVSRDVTLSLPKNWVPWITSTKNMVGDGHCGFRVISELMEFGENGWSRICKDLHRELTTYPDAYAKMFLENSRVDSILYILHRYDPWSSKKNWFVLPEMGYLVASAYNVVLISLSDHQSFTFLPLRTSPPNIPKKMCMALVENDHFVEVFLRDGHPYPPVAVQWHSNRHTAAEPWLRRYQETTGMTCIRQSSETVQL